MSVENRRREMTNGQNLTDASFEAPPPGAVRRPEPIADQEGAAQSSTAPETGGAEEVVATPEARDLVGVDDRLLSVKQVIETQLMQRAQTGRCAGYGCARGRG
jgi:hypothetical protein